MKKKTHGGKRPGAGRPKTGLPRAVSKSVTLPPDLVDRTDSFAERNGSTFSEVTKLALEDYLPAENGKAVEK